MNFSSVRFDWEADSSKTYLMSTSQDLHRLNSIDHSSFALADWASVMEPFQRKSTESYHDNPYAADKWSSELPPIAEAKSRRTSIFGEERNSLKEEGLLSWRSSVRLSSDKTDNIFRGVIKLTLIANQRLKYGLYKMRTRSIREAKPPKLLTAAIGFDRASFEEGHLNSGVTFGAKTPAFSSTAPSEINFGRSKSVMDWQTEAMVRKLAATMMRESFSIIRDFRRMGLESFERERPSSRVNNESKTSLPRRVVPSLDIGAMITDTVKYSGEESRLVPGKMEKNSKSLSPVSRMLPDLKQAQEKDESPLLPQLPNPPITTFVPEAVKKASGPVA